MKNVHNALSDTLEDLGIADRYREEVQTFDDDRLRTVARLYAKDTDELRLELEILEDDSGDEEHVVCILRRVGLSHRAAGRIADTLLDIL